MGTWLNSLELQGYQQLFEAAGYKTRDDLENLKGLKRMDLQKMGIYKRGKRGRTRKIKAMFRGSSLLLYFAFSLSLSLSSLSLSLSLSLSFSFTLSHSLSLSLAHLQRLLEGISKLTYLTEGDVSICITSHTHVKVFDF